MEPLYEELASLFLDYGYEWKTDSGYVVPTASDIARVVDSAKSRLYDSEPNSYLETGRLIIQKIHNTQYAVYLHIGDTK